MQLGPGGGWNACRAILGWSTATITSTKLKHSAPRKDPDSRCRTKKLPTRKEMDGGSSKSTLRGQGKGELRAPCEPTHHLSDPPRSTRQQKTPDRFSLVADPALRLKRIPGLQRRKTTSSFLSGPLGGNRGMKKKVIPYIGSQTNCRSHGARLLYRPRATVGAHFFRFEQQERPCSILFRFRQTITSDPENQKNNLPIGPPPL